MHAVQCSIGLPATNWGSDCINDEYFSHAIFLDKNLRIPNFESKLVSSRIPGERVFLSQFAMPAGLGPHPREKVKPGEREDYIGRPSGDLRRQLAQCADLLE